MRQAEIGRAVRHLAILNNDEKVVTFGDVDSIFHYPNVEPSRRREWGRCWFEFVVLMPVGLRRFVRNLRLGGGRHTGLRQYGAPGSNA